MPSSEIVSAYQERLDQADFPGRVSRARNAWFNLPDDRRGQTDSLSPGLMPRIQTVLEFVQLVVDRSEAELVGRDAIDGLGTLLARLETAAQNFQQDGGQTHLQTADSTLDEILRLLPSFPGAAPRVTSQAISRAATTARQEFGRQITELETQLSTLESHMTAAASAAAERESELQERLAQIQASIETQRAQINEVIATYQKQFSEQQDARATEFRSTLESIKAEFDQFNNETSGRVEHLLNEVQQKKEQVEEFVEVAVATGTANAYGTEAVAQRRVADYLRLVAILVALGAVLVGVGLVRGSPDLEETIARGLTTIVLTGIAGYLANQSARHRGREERSKRIELELVSFDPFIQSLDDAKKKELRESYVEKLFQGDSGTKADVEVALTESSITALDHLVGVLKKLIK